MASYTEHLNLLKKDPVADASDTFNIQTMMNDNWDKIDAGVDEAASKASTHAAQHAAGGSDPVTPGSIGAAEVGHTHTPAGIGAAPAVHTHDDRYFTEGESLSAATAGLFGLGSGTVPNDVLAWVGKYNQHWWKRRTISTQIALGAETSLTLSDVSSTSTTVAISYSSGLEANLDTIDLALDEPISSISISYNTYTNANTLKGKFFQLGGAIYYTEPTATDATRTNINSWYQVYLNAKLCTLTVNFGIFEHVQSADRNAYPDSGVSGDYEYQYLGIPFENSAGAPKIATGFYIGTGTCGSNSPTSLTFDFVPKLVFVYVNAGFFSPHTYSSAYGGWNGGFLWVSGMGGACTGAAGATAIMSLSGNTLSWYSASSAVTQLNTSGTTYKYLAIG